MRTTTKTIAVALALSLCILPLAACGQRTDTSADTAPATSEANASAADFEVILSAENLPDDIYSLGLIFNYKANGQDKFDYVELPETVTFTVLSSQFLGDVQLTD
jgi:hypothetical protein